MAGVKYDATYRVTTVDPPELVKFIKDKHQDVKREVPFYPVNYKRKELAGKAISMWNLIPIRLMPPTRLVRYCCHFLKESGGDGRLAVTGVRWEESSNRRKNQGIVTIVDKRAHKNKDFLENPDFQMNKSGGVVLTNDNSDSRRVIEQCYKRHKTTLNPIIEWSDKEVLDFIRSNQIPYCDLYDDGFERLGCIGCPLARQSVREKELSRWPKYKIAYLNSFEKMLEKRKEKNIPTEWQTAQDVFNWWMEYDILPGQVDWFEEMEEE